MKLIYTHHAIARMRQRGITKDQVVFALTYGRRGTAKEGQLEARTKRIRVIYGIGKNAAVTIITAAVNDGSLQI